MKNLKKIIVIEDDADINTLISYNLRKEGFSVEQAFDGFTAREKLANGYFNIVILDIMLPGIDGFDICKEIKGDDGLSKVFVVVVSAKSNPQDKLYAHILGADCYLTKPFKVETLVRTVKEISEMQNKEFEVTSK
jgi:two-component system alkaline phosphatase synthesis response regulator PhoP